MSIAAIKAGKAFYELFAEDKTDKGLKSAEQRLKAFGVRVGLIGASIAGFAAAGLTGLGAMLKGFASAGDDLDSAMKMTGVSTDFLQSLKFGAAGVGVSFDALLGAINKMNIGMIKAAQSGKSFLGLDPKKLMAMSADDRFKALVDEIAKLPTAALQAKAAMEVFGKAGVKLLPLLQGGAKGLDQALADLQSRGMILSPADVALAMKAQGAWMLLTLSFKHISNLIGASVAPLWLKLAEVLQTVTEQVAKFINNNREIVKWLAIGLSVILAVGAALMLLGAASIFAGLAIQGFGIVWAALTSPITLVIVAIVAVGAAAIAAAYYLDQLYNSGKGLAFLQYMAQAAAEAFRGLWLAISSGRWDLAGQLIMDGFNAAFTDGVTALMQIWLGLRDFMLTTMIDAVAGVMEILQIAGETIGVDLGLGSGVDFAEEIKRTLQEGTEATLNERGEMSKDAWAKYRETLADIAKLDAKDKIPGKDDLRDFGSLSDSFKQFSGGTVGATLSSNAGRLNWAAPGNESTEDKQLDVQMEMRDLLDQLVGEVGGLEGLTAD